MHVVLVYTVEHLTRVMFYLIVCVNGVRVNAFIRTDQHST
jgi:hypothetical protein